MLSNTLRLRALSQPGPRVTAFIIVLFLLCAWGAIALGGTKTGIALALLAAFGPIALYAAFTAPIVFPFTLYLVLVPFDNLLTIDAFGTMTKLLGLASAGAIALRMLLMRRHVVPDKAILSWLPLLLLSLVSLSWATDSVAAITQVGALLSLFALYALLSFTPIDRKSLGIIIVAIIIGGIIASAYGAYLFHAGQGLTSEDRLVIRAGDEGRKIDPNHFAASLLVPLALAVTAFVEAKRLSLRVFSVAAIALIGIGILVSGSRGGVVSSAVVLGVLIWRSRKRMMIIGLALAGGGLGLAAFSNVIARFALIGATQGSGRLAIWRVGAVAFSRHPIFGWGAGNFSVGYNDAFLSVPAFASMKIVEGAHFTIAPHNNLLWVAVELGAAGLIAFLYAWWMQLRALRTIPERSDLYPLRIAVEAAIIGQFVCGLFLGTLVYKYLWLAFMLAMIVRNAELEKGGVQRENVVSPILQTAARRG